MNRNIVICSLLILVLINPPMKSQSLKFGFRLEPAILFTEENNGSSTSFTPYSFYLAAFAVPTEWITLEIRPGLFLAGEEYSGFEIGAFSRFKILPTKIYLIAGLNNHSNGSSGHNSGGSYSKGMLYKGVGIGFQKDSKLSFDLIYYWSDNKTYAYTRITDSTGHTTNADKNMNGILKVSFCLAWDIL